MKRLLPITLVIVSAILFVLNLAYQYQIQVGADVQVDAYEAPEQHKTFIEVLNPTNNYLQLLYLLHKTQSHFVAVTVLMP